MKQITAIIKVIWRGPGNVSREISIAAKVIAEWNRTNWEATGCGLVSRHWRNEGNGWLIANCLVATWSAEWSR